MPTWAKRGLQTALVTGGLLMLGTSIASASENVNPDRPASPIDGGLDVPLHNDHADTTPAGTVDTLAGDLTAPATEEAHALDTTHATTQAAPSGVATTELGQVEHVIDAGLAGGGVDSTATRTGGDVTPSSEWGVLSGDLLADPQRAAAGPDATLFRVPLSVVGRAIEHNDTAAPATDEDAQPQFGPSDAADSLLGANQVPVIGDLFTVPNLRNVTLGAPLSTLDQTQQFPAIGRLGMPELAATQQFPAIGGFSDITRQLPVINDGFLLPAQRAQSRPTIRPVAPARQSTQDMAVAPAGRYLPMTGNLPAAGQLAAPGLPSLPTAGLPALPAAGVPALPTAGVPALPNAALPTLPAGAPPVSANLPTVGKPSVPSLPAAGLPNASLPAVGALPLAGAAPLSANVPTVNRPSTQALPTAGLPGLPTPAVPSLPTAGVPALPTASVPSLPALPNAALPAAGVPSLPKPAVPSLPTAGVPALPTASVPSLPALPNAALPAAGVPSLPKPAVPSLPTAGVPALPNASVPSLPSASLPLVGGAPVSAVSPQSESALPGLPALPDLPPVPTLPAMPQLPTRPTQGLPASLPGLPNVPTPAVSGPSVPSIPGLPAAHLPAQGTLPVPSLFTPAVPAVQDMPAGSAQQLMAQLRDLISDLENSASGAPTRMYPMQEPPAL